MEDFQSFIDIMNLVDLPIVGNLFTWIKSDGSAASRIDRFLISDGLLGDWKIMAQWIGARDISD